MKYRIIEKHDSFYPQEKCSFLFNWYYVDSQDVNFTWRYKHYSKVSSYEDAISVIERRKEYLQNLKIKKIHNI